MAIASKPSSKLVVDGIWGPKSREATSYLLTADISNYPTQASSLAQVFSFNGYGSCVRLQILVNSKRLADKNGSTVPTRTAARLVVDGLWGPATALGLARTMIAVHQGGSMNLFPGGAAGSADVIYGQVGNSILFWQSFLNNAIFNTKGLGPWVQAVGMHSALRLNSSEFSTDSYLWSQL
jgi:hypothetical protein